MSKKIEFVDYTGSFPNLCSGVLTVKINGKETQFGNGWIEDNDDGTVKRQYYPPFWVSTGAVWFDNDWNETVELGPWEYDEGLEDYSEFDEDDIKELMEVFNANVPQGCCGGCV